MITKYRTRWNTIDAVEVLRETKEMVFHLGYKGQEKRETKRSEFQNWHDTFDEAKAWLIANVKADIDIAHLKIARLEDELLKILHLSEGEQLPELKDDH